MIAFVSLLGLLAPSSVLSEQQFWSSPFQKGMIQRARELQQQVAPTVSPWQPTSAPSWYDDDWVDPHFGLEQCYELLYLLMEGSDDFMDCFCDFNNFGVPAMTCNDRSCETCDEFGESCGTTMFTLTFDGTSVPFANLTSSFQYISGPYEPNFVSFEQYECDYDEPTAVPCKQCNAFLNFRRCNSCEVCESEGFVVDCENLEMGSTFDYCEAMLTGESIEGAFEAVMYDNLICDGDTVAPNGMCANATFLSPENPSDIQTLDWSIAAEPLPFCSYDQYQPTGGLWYSIIGTGNIMSVSTCSPNTYFETTVSVYQDGCNSLQCVPSATRPQYCYDYFPGAAVSWVSEPGRLYHVLVGSRYGEIAQFEINWFEVSEATDGCNDAQRFEIDGPPVAQALDSDFLEPNDDACFRAFAPGAWYAVSSPEDTVLRASTCSGITNFYTGISVMEGTECGSLTCVAYMESFEYVPNCGETGAQIEWEAKSGALYYVLVHGEFEERGIFSLSITSLNPPPNDVCDTAFLLGSIGDDGQGSLVDATMVGENFHNYNETGGIPYCPYSYSGGPGVWYAVIGSGRPMRVTACRFFGGLVGLSLYSGSCSSLDCVGAGQYDASCDNGGEGSSVGFNSVANETYYVLVQSYEYYDDGSVFELFVEEAFPPENDECSAVMDVVEPGSGVIYGTTVDAIFDGVVSCYAGSSSGGLWYKVIGTGQAMRADTCYDSSQYFDSELSVYGGTCDSLQCISANDDSCGLSSAVTWATEPGVDYFIRVNGLGSGVGEFWLNITAFDPAENDLCSTGSPLFPDDTVFGTVTGATQDLVPHCNSYPYEEPYPYPEEEEDVYYGHGGAGVWYYIDVEEESGLTASTCSTRTSFYGSIRVFGGSCDSLVCVSGPSQEDYSCGREYPGSVATWLGEAGQRYFILVTDYYGSGGDFGLTITTFEPVGNDNCAGAFTLSPAIVEQGTLDGSTALGEYNATISCTYYNFQPGVWYVLEGIGGPMRVSGCAFETDIMLSLYNGTCDSLECLAVGTYNNRCMRYGGSSVTWNSVAGEEYYLLVQSSYQNTGSFELSIEQVSPPDNDECSAAIGPVLPGSDALFGSTIDAIFDGVFSCYLGSNSGGLWYFVVGDGQVMRADTCSGLTNHDTELAVYQGDCDSLRCLDADNDSCGVSSAVTWQTVEGERYLIRVNGYGSNVGDFGLTVRSLEPVANQECATRLALEPGESIVQTLDLIQHEEPVPFFCFGDHGFLGVWYEVIGTGNVFAVSTCSENTFAETIVTVFQGNCGLLECVPGAEQQEYCTNYYPGGSVTWPSESGLSYKVFVGLRYYEGNYDHYHPDRPPYDGPEYGDDMYVDDDFRGRRAEEAYGDDWIEGEDNYEEGHGGGFGFGPQIEVSVYEFTESSLVCGEQNLFVEIDGPNVTGSISSEDYFGVEDDACFRAYRQGAWYRVESPVDVIVRASTCSLINYFYTGISVMQGSDCGSLSCVAAAGPYDGFAGCGEGGSVVEWAAEAGTSYFVLVHGDYEQRGLFSLSVTSLTPPANDVCDGAFSLSLDSGDTISLVNATSVGENVTYCTDQSYPGTWYTITGTGNPMRVSVCLFDIGIMLSAYMGPCTNLTCIGAGTYSYNTGACMGLDGTSVSWNSEVGEVYYILAQRTYGNEDGSVEISVEEVIAPSNDDCFGAMEINEIGSDLIFGSTMDAIFSDISDADYNCLRGSLSPGLWYRVVGTGQAMRADTCFDTSGQFDPEIAVYNGTCSDLQCIGSNDDSCGLSSAITWSTIEGVEYFIRVKGLGTLPIEFWLNVTAFDPAENDVCAMGLPLFSNDIVSGSMNGATSDVVPYCSNYYYNEVGVWYYIDGNNTSLRLSLCSASPSLHFAQVYSGSCDSLFCVSSSSIQEIFCGDGFPGTVASWFAEAGQRYYILVSTEFEGAGGDFDVTLSEFKAVENDVCVGAERLAIEGIPSRGSTRNATSDAFASCRHSDGPGVWYSIVGNGQVVNVTTCSEELNFDAVMTVSVGDCDGYQECIFYAAYNEPNCYSSFYAASTATWRAEEGVTYYILVQGYSPSDVGEFVLSVTTYEPSGNDECFRATPIRGNGTLITGSTLGATYDPSISYCSGYSSPDVWYSIAGTGSELTASTCNSRTDYDSALSIYTSFDGGCRDVVCETTNDDACNSASSEVSWFAASGLTYLIRVHGYSTASGNFGLTVSGGGDLPGEDGDGDSCDTAVGVPSADGSLILGSTRGRGFSGVDQCSGFDSPDVWYAIIGTGNEVTASTCHSETNFDSYLSVYLSGDRTCGSLRCWASNDDNCGGSTSELTWFAGSGEVYYLRVHGFGGASGEYGLTISSAGSENNDECEGATEVDPSGMNSIFGDTNLASYSGWSGCGGAASSSSPDLWYRVEGSGARMVASTCSDYTAFDTQISVYQGNSCSRLICLDGNDDSCSTRSTVEWFADSFTTYYVRVYGFSSNSGRFELSVGPADSSDQSRHDHCATAIPADPFSSHSGSTVEATPDPMIGSCGGASAVVAKGVWYSVMGTGFPLIASTCEGSNFDTQITVFVGFSCSDLECVDGSDQHCGDQSLVEFDTVPGIPYYILVHGYLSAEGDFTLSIYSNDVGTPEPSWPLVVETEQEGGEYQMSEATDVVYVDVDDNGE